MTILRTPDEIDRLTISGISENEMDLFSDIYNEHYGLRPGIAYKSVDVMTSTMMVFHRWNYNEWSLSAVLDTVIAEDEKHDRLALQRNGIKAIINQWEHGEIG